MQLYVLHFDKLHIATKAAHVTRRLYELIFDDDYEEDEEKEE